MNTKTIFWTLGGIATVVGGYFIYKRVIQPTEYIGDKSKDGISEIIISDGGSTTTSSNDGLPLKRGSKGDKVTQLQKFLVSEGYSIGSFGILSDGVDGDFGRMTETAVRENQKPFATFKSMYPTAVEGQVSADFFNSNIKGRF
tara:strand:+ start:6663 stop:7091 length:429 start_codon:yes stop_codon:yes gene_type:complete